jgi:MFS transporter, DHA2 family, methylenomycin A resistance protein
MAASSSPRLTLAATSVSYIVVILDTSIVNVALERIAQGLAVGVSGLQWIVNGYTLTFASLLLTGGTLADRWGAKRVYAAGLALFTAASGLCGAAPSLPALIGARALQGIGAALLVPCSLALLDEAYPDAGERAKAIGFWAGCGGAALAGGPLAGGVLIDLLGWRSIFLFNLPIGLAGIWLTWRIAAARRSGGGRRLDLAGQVLAVLALGGLTAALIEGPALGWSSPAILGLWAVAAAAAALFLTVEARRAEPMLPLRLFRAATFSAAAGAALITTLTLFGLVFVLSLYFQEIRRQSPLVAGLAFLPMTAVVTGGNIVSGRWAARAGPRWPLAAGSLAAAAGFAGLLIVGDATPYALLAPALLAIGIGGGLATPAAAAALMAAADRRHAGIASGVLNTARQVGTAVGVALFGALVADPARFLSGFRAAALIAAGLALSAAFVAARFVGTDGRARRQVRR